MSCPELLRTQAYLDGELDGVSASEAERHIESCAECQKASADAAQLSDAIRRDLAPHRAPAALRARIGSALDAEASSNVAPFGRRNFWYGALSGAGAMAAAASVAFLLILPPSAETLAQSIVDDHTAALRSGHLIQIASSSHHVVKPWFAGKVDVSPPTPDFPDRDFALAGGRVDRIAGSRAAVVVYKHGRHVIDLFVWPDRGSALPGNATRHGYHSIFWKSGDLNFAAVSDAERRELEKFVTLIRNAPE
ncbi:MAG TPA: zf-HC2 domain-containing protein [Rhizomicrobium sp.]|nr:zf-HC2 domain-containing protein [Rhizomicrobium sp.]